jgi:hypothetical protein
MATDKQIRARVLAYYDALYPGSTESTKFKDIGRKPQQVLDDGEELAIELNCDPDRSDIAACKTIGALSALLIKTKSTKKSGVLHESAIVGLRISRLLYPKA